MFLHFYFYFEIEIKNKTWPLGIICNRMYDFSDYNIYNIWKKRLEASIKDLMISTKTTIISFFENLLKVKRTNYVSKMK